MHVAGKVDPISDIEVINTELLLADMDTAEKAVYRVGKNAKSGNKAAIAEKALMEKVVAHIDAGKPVRSMELSDAEEPLVHQLHLLTAKPVMYIANVDEDGFDDNAMLDKVREYANNESATVVAVCASIEAEIALPVSYTHLTLPTIYSV